MHCNACDRQLSEKEIIWNGDLKAWEMCGTCLEIVFDAVYVGQFKNEEDEWQNVDEDFDNDNDNDYDVYGLSLNEYLDGVD